MASTGLHGASFIVHLYYLQRCQSFFNVLRAKGGLSDFGGEYRFLTQLAHIINAIYFATALVADLQRVLWRKRSASLTTAKELLFSLAIVLASMTVILFWGLYYFVNPHAVGYSSIYPDDLNRFQHGFVAVLVLLDLLLCRHEQVRASAHYVVLLSFVGGYIVWMAYTTSISGHWPYPFLDELDLVGHLIFYTATTIFGSILLYITLRLLALRWPAVRPKRE